MSYSFPEGCAFNTEADIANKKITIMGLGLNGGGEAAVRFFLSKGAYVTVTDMKTKEQLQPTLLSLKEECIQYKDKLNFVLGCHRLEDFSEADVVIKNPGVKYEGNKYLAVAKKIETDISIFLQFTEAPIIAVTGSKGKSSTVSAIHYGLIQAGFNAFLGGNITVSPLTFLDKTNTNTPVVLELSSWQLADLRGRKLLKPFIALITTIVPDHQNWYGSMEAYVNDKRLIYADQNSTDWTICNTDFWGNSIAAETKAQILQYENKPINKISNKHYGCYFNEEGKGFVYLPQNKHFSEPKIVLDKLLVPGKHMRINALNAALVLALMGTESDKIKEILAKWQGIQHRLEYFHSWTSTNSLQYNFYNDSAATVPEAAAAANNAFNKPVNLICGGTDKELDFNILANNIKESTPASLWLLEGSGTQKLLSLLKEKNITFNGPFNSLEELLKELHKFLLKNTNPSNNTIVFSPGATSFGMFKNEFDRGNNFKKEVLNIFK